MAKQLGDGSKLTDLVTALWSKTRVSEVACQQDVVLTWPV